jgi:hypothetical protein
MNISIANQSATWCLFIDGKKISCHFINGILANPSISFPIYEERDINFIVAYFQKK